MATVGKDEMDVKIVRTKGLPCRGSMLSLKLGAFRRQGPLPCLEAFRIPRRHTKVQIHIYRVVARTQSGTFFDHRRLSRDGLLRVPLVSKLGKPVALTMRASQADHELVESKPPSQAFLFAGSDAGEDLTDEKEQCWEYLDAYYLKDFLREAFEILMETRPADPFAWLAEMFRNAAEAEAMRPNGAPPQPPPKLQPPASVSSGNVIDFKCFSPIMRRARVCACGNNLLDDSKFCRKCGKPWEVSWQAPEARRADLSFLSKELPVFHQSMSGRSLVLLSRAKNTLVAGNRCGSLHRALSETRQLVTLSVPNTRVNLLCARAKETLVKASKDGRLRRVLEKVPNMITLAPVNQHTVQGAAALRCRARSTLTSAVRNGQLNRVLATVGRELGFAPPQQVSRQLFKACAARVDAAALRRRARECLVSAQQEGRLVPALSQVPQLAVLSGVQETDRRSLVARARQTLVEGTCSGRLPIALAQVPQVMQLVSASRSLNGDSTVDRAPILKCRARATLLQGNAEGSLQWVLSEVQQPMVLHQPAQQLRARARECLASGLRDGRLRYALQGSFGGLKHAAVSRDPELLHQQFKAGRRVAITNLRARASRTLEAASRSGRLLPALEDVQQLHTLRETPCGAQRSLVAHARVTLTTASRIQGSAEGSLQWALSQVQQPMVLHQPSQQLRSRARECLASGLRDGRLRPALLGAYGGLKHVGFEGLESHHQHFKVGRHVSITDLRLRARSTLEAGLTGGRLLSALEDGQQLHTLRETPGSARRSLIARARATLTFASRNGRLGPTVADVVEPIRVPVALTASAEQAVDPRVRALQAWARATLVRGISGRLPISPSSPSPVRAHLRQVTGSGRDSRSMLDAALAGVGDDAWQVNEGRHESLHGLRFDRDVFKASAQRSCATSLLARARKTLAQGCQSGRLQQTLEDVPQLYTLRSTSASYQRCLVQRARCTLVGACRDGRLPRVCQEVPQSLMGLNESAEAVCARELFARSRATLIDGQSSRDLQNLLQGLDSSAWEVSRAIAGNMRAPLGSPVRRQHQPQATYAVPASPRGRFDTDRFQQGQFTSQGRRDLQPSRRREDPSLVPMAPPEEPAAEDNEPGTPHVQATQQDASGERQRLTEAEFRRREEALRSKEREMRQWEARRKQEDSRWETERVQWEKRRVEEMRAIELQRRQLQESTINAAERDKCEDELREREAVVRSKEVEMRRWEEQRKREQQRWDDERLELERVHQEELEEAKRQRQEHVRDSAASSASERRKREEEYQKKDEELRKREAEVRAWEERRKHVDVRWDAQRLVWQQRHKQELLEIERRLQREEQQRTDAESRLKQQASEQAQKEEKQRQERESELQRLHDQIRAREDELRQWEAQREDDARRWQDERSALEKAHQKELQQLAEQQQKEEKRLHIEAARQRDEAVRQKEEEILRRLATAAAARPEISSPVDSEARRKEDEEHQRRLEELARKKKEVWLLEELRKQEGSKWLEEVRLLKEKHQQELLQIDRRDVEVRKMEEELRALQEQQREELHKLEEERRKMQALHQEKIAMLEQELKEAEKKRRRHPAEHVGPPWLFDSSEDKYRKQALLLMETEALLQLALQHGEIEENASSEPEAGALLQDITVASFSAQNPERVNDETESGGFLKDFSVEPFGAQLPNKEALLQPVLEQVMAGEVKDAQEQAGLWSDFQVTPFAAGPAKEAWTSAEAIAVTQDLIGGDEEASTKPARLVSAACTPGFVSPELTQFVPHSPTSTVATVITPSAGLPAVSPPALAVRPWPSTERGKLMSPYVVATQEQPLLPSQLQASLAAPPRPPQPAWANAKTEQSSANGMWQLSHSCAEELESKRPWLPQSALASSEQPPRSASPWGAKSVRWAPEHDPSTPSSQFSLASPMGPPVLALSCGGKEATQPSPPWPIDVLPPAIFPPALSSRAKQPTAPPSPVGTLAPSVPSYVHELLPVSLSPMQPPLLSGVGLPAGPPPAQSQSFIDRPSKQSLFQNMVAPPLQPPPGASSSGAEHGPVAALLQFMPSSPESLPPRAFANDAEALLQFKPPSPKHPPPQGQVSGADALLDFKPPSPKHSPQQVQVSGADALLQFKPPSPRKSSPRAFASDAEALLQFKPPSPKHQPPQVQVSGADALLQFKPSSPKKSSPRAFSSDIEGGSVSSALLQFVPASQKRPPPRAISSGSEDRPEASASLQFAPSSPSQPPRRPPPSAAEERPFTPDLSQFSLAVQARSPHHATDESREPAELLEFAPELKPQTSLSAQIDASTGSPRLSQFTPIDVVANAFTANGADSEASTCELGDFVPFALAPSESFAEAVGKQPTTVPLSGGKVRLMPESAFARMVSQQFAPP